MPEVFLVIHPKYTTTPLANLSPVPCKRPEVSSDPKDGFRPGELDGKTGYGPLRFAEQSAEVSKPSGFKFPWKGVVAGTMLALSMAGGAASAATVQTMSNPSDLKATENLEFLDYSGHLYQAKGGLLGGYKPATPTEALKQLRSGSSVYWSQADGQAKQTIKDLQSLNQFVDSVRQQSQR
ncbi:hypothetical protein JST97_18550 [bacterium]|nr:hypothetical protein [bacterium]